MVSAREVVEACAKALSSSPDHWEDFHENYRRVMRGGVLDVIRALAAQELTDAMEMAWIRVEDDASSELRAMLSALADGYEREGGA